MTDPDGLFRAGSPDRGLGLVRRVPVRLVPPGRFPGLHEDEPMDDLGRLPSISRRTSFCGTDRRFGSGPLDRGDETPSRGLPDRALTRDAPPALLVSGDRRPGTRAQDRRTSTSDEPSDVARPSWAETSGRMIGGAQYIRDIPRARRDQPLGDRRVPGTRDRVDPARSAGRGRRRATTSLPSSADVLPENHSMINVFRSSGFDLSIRATPGAIEVEFPIGLTEHGDPTLRGSRDRRRRSARWRTFLSPRSVAVIGASRDSLGDRRPAVPQPPDDRVLRSRSIPVNPKADVVHGVVAYPIDRRRSPARSTSRSSSVPADRTSRRSRSSAAGRSVRGLVVISAGFAEVGGEGARSGRRGSSRSAAHTACG